MEEPKSSSSSGTGLKLAARGPGCGSATTMKTHHLGKARQEGVPDCRGTELLGRSPSMLRMMRLVGKVAASDVKAVLIVGESGTGKELVARALHDLSWRKGAPFVPINSGAIAPSLLESELFGYVRGAFTGAVSGGRCGRIEFANGGTLFLDEIGDMDPGLQVKLLRVLESGEVRRVGANDLLQVDVRFVSATHQSLEELMEQGKFRKDLYYRLSVITIHVPPLRERGEDVLLLADHFLRSFSAARGGDPPRLSIATRDHLMGHDWPGNVRELRNTLERLVVLGPESEAGPEAEAPSRPWTPPAWRTSSDETRKVDLEHMTLGELEKVAIRFALQRSAGNRTVAANYLGISYSALRRRLARLGLS